MLYIFLGQIWVNSIIDQWLKQTLCVSYFTKLIWGTFGIGPSFRVRFLIDHLINKTIWVHLLIDQWLKQTLCVIYFTQFIWSSFGIAPWLVVHFVIDQWINQTLCVSYFTGYNLGSFGNWLVIESDTLC